MTLGVVLTIIVLLYVFDIPQLVYGLITNKGLYGDGRDYVPPAVEVEESTTNNTMRRPMVAHRRYDNRR